MFGIHFLRHASIRSLIAMLLLTLLISTILLTVLLVQSPSWRRRRVLLTAIYLITASMVVVMGGHNLADSFLSPIKIARIANERYFFFPSCLCIFVMALGMESLSGKIQRPLLKQLPAVLFLLAFSAGIADNFKVRPLFDLSWPGYAAQIETWKQQQRTNPTGAALVVPINPPAWIIILQRPN